MTNANKGKRVSPAEMQLPVRVVRSAGVLYLVVDAQDRNVSSLLTEDEAKAFAHWVNTTAKELARLRERLAGAMRIGIRRDQDGELHVYDEESGSGVGNDIKCGQVVSFILLPAERGVTP